MAKSMMVAEKAGTWQTVKSKSDDRKKRSDEKKKTAPQKDRLGVTVDPSKEVFAAIDNAWQRKSLAQKVVPASDPHGPYEGTFSGLEVEAPVVEIASPERPATPTRVEANHPNTVEANKKEKAPKAKKPKITIGQVAEGVDLAALKTYLSELEAKYGSNEVSQLEMLADFLLKTFKEVELPFNNILHEKPLEKAADLPLSEVPSDLRKVLADFIRSKSDLSVKEVLLLLMREVFAGLPEGNKAKAGVQPPRAKVGLLVLLALAVQTRPTALLVASADLYKQGRQFSAPGRLPQLLWVIHQAARVKPEVAVAVWVRVVLPQLLGTLPAGAKKNDTQTKTEGSAGGEAKDGPTSLDASCHEVALQYVNQLLVGNVMTKVAEERKGGDVIKGDGEVEPVVPGLFVETLMRGCMEETSGPSSMSRGIRSRCQSLYLLLRDVACASESTRQYEEWLPVALETAGMSNSGAFSEGDELVARASSHVVMCLLKEDKCFQVWENKHKGMLKGSARVLQHMAHSQAVLSPVLKNTDKAGAWLRLLDALPARHKFALKQGKGWQGACARASEEAIGKLRGRAASSTRSGGSSLLTVLTYLTLSGASAVVITAVLAANHQEVTALVGRYVNPVAAQQVDRVLGKVAEASLPATRALLEAAQPGIDQVKPYIEQARLAVEPTLTQATDWTRSNLEKLMQSEVAQDLKGRLEAVVQAVKDKLA